MKTIKITSLVVAIFIGQVAFAQDEAAKGKQKIYTPEQLEMLETQKEAVKQNREEFSASLSEEQRAILENKEVGMKERREALRATFTDAQKELLTANREEIKALKEQVRTTLTDEENHAH